MHSVVFELRRSMTQASFLVLTSDHGPGLNEISLTPYRHPDCMNPTVGKVKLNAGIQRHQAWKMPNVVDKLRCLVWVMEPGCVCMGPLFSTS